MNAHHPDPIARTYSRGESDFASLYRANQAHDPIEVRPWARTAALVVLGLGLAALITMAFM